jgi:hypothetical protein
LHSGKEGGATVKLAWNEVRPVVLHGDHVWPGGTGSAIDKDVFRWAVKRSEDYVQRLFEIMEGA